ncbi:MAG TPA: DeoR/GlpR family DNA-binding transcription regulator [Kiritimatiellia bacterium]|nr:DeoR/GlpR family DNA-binding transcription regulator [Kiritimatiellia bacterium]
MLALERQREIIALLAARGSARVAELAERFDVTEETIRRDLDKLEQDGRLTRSHGGAVAQEQRETPHWQREYVNTVEKEAIVREAVKLISEGDTLILDASSTSWFLAKRLPEIPLTVITNALHVSLVLAERQHCRLISTGGTLVPTSMSFVGSEAQLALRRYHAGRLFVSCRGLDLQRGASDMSEEQAMVRRVMMEISDKRYLMIDSSKLGIRALSILAPASAFSRLITDDRAPEAFCRALEDQGVPVTRAAVL